MGESGCGKSTVGRQLVGLETPTGGRLFYQGKDMEKLSGKEKKSVRTQLQMVFQDPYSSLNPRKHIYEILSQPMLYHGISNKETVHRDVDRLLDMVGLPKHVLGRFPHEFSGGQRQRIGIARALSLNPRFLVCDEPVSALDVSIQAQILNLLQDLKEQMGLTFIFITHDLSVVNHFADEIAVMYLGQLIEKAPTEELFDHPIHPYTRALLSAIPIPEVGISRPERILLKGEISSPIDPPDECRFAKRCIYTCDQCHQSCPKLMEVRPGHFVSCHLWKDFLSE